MPVSHSRFVCHFPSRFSSQTLPGHSRHSAGPSKESWALEHRGSWCFDSRIFQPPRSGEHERGSPGLVQLASCLTCSTRMVIGISRGVQSPATGDRITVFYFKITIGNGEGDKRRDDQLSDSRSRGSRCLFWWKVGKAHRMAAVFGSVARGDTNSRSFGRAGRRSHGYPYGNGNYPVQAPYPLAEGPSSH